jgi:hypothetical protein
MIVENLNKFVGNLVRVGVVFIIGVSLYLIYSNYDSFSIRKNLVQVKPQTTARINVTSAE